jgi:glycosyltransferase involved in cell wall biosynthesis
MEGYELVSIVIPVNPSSHTLPLALKSAFGQTYEKVEVIAVGEVKGRHSVRLIPFSGGRSAARNLGVLKARGSFILFLDSDQVMTGEVVEECIKACRHVDMVKIPEVFLGLGFWERCSAAWRNTVSMVDGGIPRFYRKEAILASGLFDPSISLWEDFDLYRRLKERGRKEAWCKAKLIHIEPHPSSQILKAFKYGSSLHSSAKRLGGFVALARLTLFMRTSIALLRSSFPLTIRLGGLFFALARGVAYGLGMLLSLFKR